MFFYLSKIFSALLFPYPLFIILALIVGFRLRARFPGKAFLFCSIALALASTGIVSSSLIAVLERRYSAPPPDSRAQVVVVLAGMVNPLSMQDGRVEFMGAVDRILAGQDLLRQSRVDSLLLSGGSGLMLQGPSESAILERWLLERGVRPGQILIEKDSRNTAENARMSVELLRKQSIQSAFLVTSAFHMLRAQLCFEKMGFKTIPFPVDYYHFKQAPFPEAYVPTPQSLAIATIAIKEFAGLLAYWLAGYI